MKTFLHHGLRTFSASMMLIGLLTPTIAAACGCRPSDFTILKGAPTTVRPGEELVYQIFADGGYDPCAGEVRCDQASLVDSAPPGLEFVGVTVNPPVSPSIDRHPQMRIMYKNVCPADGAGNINCKLILCSGPSGPTEPPTEVTMRFRVPENAACGTVFHNQASVQLLTTADIGYFAPVPSNIVATTVVCGSSSSAPSSSSSSSSSSTPGTSSSSSSTPLASSSSSTPVVVIPVTGPSNTVSNSTAIASNVSNNQNMQNVSIFNAGDTITVGAPNINVNTGGANVAVNATASPSTSVVNNTQGAAQYQPQYPPYPQYPSYPPPAPVYPVPQPPQQIIIEKPVVIPPPIVIQPLPQTGIGDFTGPVEDTGKFMTVIGSGSSGVSYSFWSIFVAIGLAAAKMIRNGQFH